MPRPKKKKRILLVDDDDVFRNQLSRALANRGYDVLSASSAEEAQGLRATDSLDYAVLDLRMPGKSGLSLIEMLRKKNPKIRIVVLTGYGSIANALEATRLGAVNYLTKPADADEVLEAFYPEGAPAAELAATPSLARTEWEHINRVLEDCDGNISQAAQKLGIHRRSLQRKLQKYPPRD